MLSGGAKLGADEMRHLWNKARAALTKDPTPEDSKKTLTLEVRPEEVKVLYARILALQSLMDGRLDPREIECSCLGLVCLPTPGKRSGKRLPPERPRLRM
jgi:Trp operon repressor